MFMKYCCFSGLSFLLYSFSFFAIASDEAYKAEVVVAPGDTNTSASGGFQNRNDDIKLKIVDDGNEGEFFLTDTESDNDALT